MGLWQRGTVTCLGFGIGMILLRKQMGHGEFTLVARRSLSAFLAASSSESAAGLASEAPSASASFPCG